MSALASAFSAGFFALVMCFQTFVIRRQRTNDAVANLLDVEIYDDEIKDDVP